MTLLVESMPSIVDRMPPAAALEYLKGRSDMLEMKYQAMLNARARMGRYSAPIRVTEWVNDFQLRRGAVLDRPMGGGHAA